MIPEIITCAFIGSLFIYSEPYPPALKKGGIILMWMIAAGFVAASL